MRGYCIPNKFPVAQTSSPPKGTNSPKGENPAMPHVSGFIWSTFRCLATHIHMWSSPGHLRCGPQSWVNRGRGSAWPAPDRRRGPARSGRRSTPRWRRIGRPSARRCWTWSGRWRTGRRRRDGRRRGRSAAGRNRRHCVGPVWPPRGRAPMIGQLTGGIPHVTHVTHARGAGPAVSFWSVALPCRLLVSPPSRQSRKPYAGEGGG